MTVHPCPHCGEYMESMQADCPKCMQPANGVRFTVALPQVDATPEGVGAEIRRLLFVLRVPGHTEEKERAGTCNHGSDLLRAQALDAANICWFGSGKMHNPSWRCNGRPKKLDDPSWTPPEATP